jgi:hypothetical protein
MTQRSRFGQVRKLPSGRFQARYTIPGTDRRTAAPMTFQSKLDAETWLSVQRADLARGTWKPPTPRRPLTLAEYADRWLTERDLRPCTVAHYRRILHRFLLPPLGDVPLSKITPRSCAPGTPGSSPGRSTATTPTRCCARSCAPRSTTG